MTENSVNSSYLIKYYWTKQKNGFVSTSFYKLVVNVCRLYKTTTGGFHKILFIQNENILIAVNCNYIPENI